MRVPDQIDHAPVRLPTGTRVLIVEDQPLVAMALADMVASLGGVVAQSAASIDAALAAVAEGGFAVALLDIDLRGETSQAVAAALVAADRPFLITSGSDGQSIEGFDQVPLLMKPFLPNQLGVALLTLLAPENEAA